MIFSVGVYAQPQSNRVTVVTLEGTITVMSAELVEETLRDATTTSHPVILLINTPGGNLDATFRIIEAIERSSVPVIGYVSPGGATAWSAGTFILLSTHVAAMAPHTLIGSAQPVAYSPFGGAEPINDPKTVNALTAYLVERARIHGRNETAARLFVEENLNLSADDAVAQNVVEVVAPSLSELLTIINDTEVNLPEGSYHLQTAGAEIVQWSPNIRIWVLRFLSDPILAYLLFIVGLYGLIFGITSPGYSGEVIGAICIVLGLIGLGFSGVSIGGLILIGVGAILLLAELFTPGFGLLGGGGFFCIVLGGLLLFPPGPWIVSAEWFNLFRTVIIIVPVAIGIFFIFAAYKVIKVRRSRPFVHGIIGEIGETVEEIPNGKTGFIIYKGEYWKAKSSSHIAVGQKVKIINKEGPVLTVQPEES